LIQVREKKKINQLIIYFIHQDYAYSFDKYDSSLVNTQNTPYDYASVMHYESDAFSSNGLPTIESLQPGVTFGRSDNMSTIDIQEVRLFYKCSSNGVTFPPMPTTTTGLIKRNKFFFSIIIYLLNS
jgi:hypothetical protein